MNKKSARDLLISFQSGNLTDEERAMLDSWYLTRSRAATAELEETELLEELEKLRASLPILRQAPPRVPAWKKMAVAASLLILLAGAGFFYLHKVSRPPAPVASVEIAAGRNGATLTLHNGQQIKLNSSGNGQLAVQGTVSIVKSDSGLIRYETGSGGETALLFNTVTTGRSEQFALVLSDGTKVWLNAASSIQYPVSFSDTARTVAITGEAYFEVSPDKAKPFSVKANGQLVQVTGTHFNVNAYTDEPVTQTTLLEGSVMVSQNGQTVYLKPGEGARSGNNGTIQKVSHADTEQAVAWKSGYFSFNDAGVAEVMRQLARWYDIDVIYEGRLPQKNITGSMERNLSGAQAFKLISGAGIHLRVNGRKVTVSAE